MAEGEDWRIQRKILAPAFRNNTIQQLIPVIQNVVEKNLQKYSDMIIKESSAQMTVTEESREFALGVITAVAFICVVVKWKRRRSRRSRNF